MNNQGLEIQGQQSISALTVSLGEIIRDKRQSLGLTQMQLGKLCGYSDGNIWKIEKNRPEASNSAKQKVIHTLDLIEKNGITLARSMLRGKGPVKDGIQDHRPKKITSDITSFFTKDEQTLNFTLSNQEHEKLARIASKYAKPASDLASAIIRKYLMESNNTVPQQRSAPIRHFCIQAIKDGLTVDQAYAKITQSGMKNRNGKKIKKNTISVYYGRLRRGVVGEK